MASRQAACLPDHGSTRITDGAATVPWGRASTARVYVVKSGDFFRLSGIIPSSEKALTARLYF
jgi:hypothetical protein